MPHLCAISGGSEAGCRRNHLKNDALQLITGFTKLEELCLHKNKFTVIPPEFCEFR